MSRKRNHQMAMRTLRLHPAERQKLRRTWSAQTIEAQIHALTGENAGAAVEKIGALMLITLTAAVDSQVPQDSPEMRIIAASANCLSECVGRQVLTDLQRATLSSCLEAMKRLVATLREETLFHATMATQRRLASGGDVTLGDIVALREAAC